MKKTLLFCVLLAGCEDREIKVYEVAREKTAEAQTAAVGAKPRWIVPADWQELPPSGMRAASFSSPGNSGAKLDISVVTFPGEAGGLLANVNRWRGQMKLEPASNVENLETLSIEGQPMQIVELLNPVEKTAMLGAIFLRQDQSWFVKLTGAETDLAGQKENFRQFALSFRFSEQGQPPVQSTNDG